MKQDIDRYSLNLRSGPNYRVSPDRADGEDLYTWWRGFLASGEAPSLRDVTSGLGWEVSRVRRALKYLVSRRGWRALPGAERLRADLHRARRYRWGGAMSAWAPVGSAQWVVFYYGCKTCGAHAKSGGRTMCKSCRDVSCWVPLDDVYLDDAPEAGELLAVHLSTLVEDMLKVLPPRDALVLRARYGLGGSAQTQWEIASVLGVTHTRVQQIEAKALAMLKKRFAHLRGSF